MDISSIFTHFTGCLHFTDGGCCWCDFILIKVIFTIWSAESVRSVTFCGIVYNSGLFIKRGQEEQLNNFWKLSLKKRDKHCITLNRWGPHLCRGYVDHQSELLWHHFTSGG